MQRIADTMTPSQLMASEPRQQLAEICCRHLGEDVVCYSYSGVKLYCDRSTYLQIADDNVRKITRANAGEAMTCLLDDGIPTDVDFLLADDAVFAYYLDDGPVAFAGTHPVGDMSDRIGNVMVGTHRDHRGRGYGKAVVSATAGSLLDQGRVAVYGTSEDNFASQKIALSVGYQVFAHVFEVRFANA
jgi:predicted GNAT family acetyltransferase